MLTPISCLCLCYCVLTYCVVEDVSGGGFRITTPERVYILQAENHESKLLWVQVRPIAIEQVGRRLTT